MCRWQRVLAVAFAAVLFGGVGAAKAQESDDQWLAGCKDRGGDDRARYCEVRPVQVAAAGTLRIDSSPNGAIRVTGWDQSTVSARARVEAQAPTDQEARDLAARVAIDTSDGLKATGPRSGDGRSWSVSFIVSAPRRTDLVLHATNGGISVDGLSAKIDARTTNGPLGLRNLAGDVRAATTNGPIDVALDGSSWDGAGLDVEAVNGPVRITVPDGYSAQLDAGTVNGPLRVGVPVTIQGEMPSGRRSQVKGAMGSGGAPIRAHTTNGPLSINPR
jgi:hypothetical protein